jgi:hypothetical protein
MRTNVDFNVGRTNVAAALTSAAQTSFRTYVDAQFRLSLKTCANGLLDTTIFVDH